MLLCTKIRLQVTDADAEALEFTQDKCRGLYNWWVLRLRDGEHWPGWIQAETTLKASIEHDPDLSLVSTVLLRAVYFRLDRALAHAARCKSTAHGEKPSYPRVRPRHCFFTLCYRARAVKVNGDRLVLPTGDGGRTGARKRSPTIVARLSEPAPATYREVAISRDARGHYFATFVVEVREAAPRAGGIVAFDLGTRTLATGVNGQGRVFSVGGFKGQQWYTRQLDSIRSKRDRCQKQSRRYLHLSHVYRRVAERMRHKQDDCLHKASHLIAHRLVESTVVIGDLSQRQMVIRAHQQRNDVHARTANRSWSLSCFVRMLEYKCRHAGKSLHSIAERYTTQECCRCHHRQPMPLGKRTYRCGTCGLVLGRDVNSAINLLQRFLARLGPHTALPFAAESCGVLPLPAGVGSNQPVFGRCERQVRIGWQPSSRR